MGRKILVFILSDEYSIQDSPDLLTDESGQRFSAVVDHEQKVIWLDASLVGYPRQRVIAHAVAHAWKERVEAVAET